MDQKNQMDGREEDLVGILNEHRLRRRAFLNKAMLAPTVATSTGLLAGLVSAGAAWGQVNVTVTTVFTPVTVTTLFTSPTTTLVTFPVTTLLTVPPTTTFIFTTEPPITDTMPITGPTDPHTVAEPPTLVLVATGIAAALALNARYRAAVEPTAAEPTAAGPSDI